jgi:hypothetical protein
VRACPKSYRVSPGPGSLSRAARTGESSPRKPRFPQCSCQPV